MLTYTNPKRHQVGKLCLLTSKLGSGYLLDGAHPEIKLAASSLDPAAKEKVQATFATNMGDKPAKASHQPAQITAVNEAAHDEKADEEAAIKKDAIYEQKIAAWKR